tara:strand:+ start:52 stop:492 length:441 start_codon:yes stop_codon:yes gene_type:complete
MRAEKNIDWHPAKNRAAVVSIQEHIAENPGDVFNVYYFITPEYIFDHIADVKPDLLEKGFVVPEKISEVSTDFARIFVSSVYGVDPDSAINIEVGKSVSASGWGLAVPEICLKDKGVSLLDWDYESFISKETVRAINSLKAKPARL